MTKRKRKSNIKVVNNSTGTPIYMDWDKVLFQNHHFYLKIKNKKVRFGKIEDTDDIYNLCIEHYNGFLLPIKVMPVRDKYSINVVTTNGTIEKLKKFYLENRYLIDSEL